MVPLLRSGRECCCGKLRHVRRLHAPGAAPGKAERASRKDPRGPVNRSTTDHWREIVFRSGSPRTCSSVHGGTFWRGSWNSAERGADHQVVLTLLFAAVIKTISYKQASLLAHRHAKPELCRSLSITASGAHNRTLKSSSAPLGAASLAGRNDGCPLRSGIRLHGLQHRRLPDAAHQGALLDRFSVRALGLCGPQCGPFSQQLRGPSTQQCEKESRQREEERGSSQRSPQPSAFQPPELKSCTRTLSVCAW